LIQAVEALVREPARREAYGAALHARATRLFDMPVIAREYLQLYNGLGE
jgi:glycosyltransferase involved in cell wall biosynthesis